MLWRQKRRMIACLIWMGTFEKSAAKPNPRRVKILHHIKIFEGAVLVQPFPKGWLFQKCVGEKDIKT